MLFRRCTCCSNRLLRSSVLRSRCFRLAPPLGVYTIMVHSYGLMVSFVHLHKWKENSTIILPMWNETPHSRLIFHLGRRRSVGRSRPIAAHAPLRTRSSFAHVHPLRTYESTTHKPYTIHPSDHTYFPFRFPCTPHKIQNFDYNVDWKCSMPFSKSSVVSRLVRF